MTNAKHEDSCPVFAEEVAADRIKRLEGGTYGRIVPWEEVAEMMEEFQKKFGGEPAAGQKPIKILLKCPYCGADLPKPPIPGLADASERP